MMFAIKVKVGDNPIKLLKREHTEDAAEELFEKYAKAKEETGEGARYFLVNEDTFEVTGVA